MHSRTFLALISIVPTLLTPICMPPHRKSRLLPSALSPTLNMWITLWISLKPQKLPPKKNLPVKRLYKNYLVPKPIQHHRQAVVLSSRCHQVLGNAPGSMSTTTSIPSLQVHPTVLLTPLHMRYRNNLRNRIIRYLSMESQG